MSANYSHFYTGVQIVPQNTIAPSVAGDIRFNSSTNQLDIYTTAIEQLVTTNAVQTLTNKTFSGLNTSTITNGAGTLNINSSGVVTVPNTTDTLVGRSTTDTLANKTLNNTTVLTIKDGNLIIQNSADITKQLVLSASAITTGTTATFQVPSASDTLVGLTATQTLTNKVLSGNTATTLINGAGVFTLNTTGTIIVPSTTDTLVGKATTDVLTNKTLSGNIAATLISGTGTLTLNTSGVITIPSTTDTLVGQITTDTLTNKTIGDALTLTQTATPTTPGVGLNKIYAKTDGNIYKLTPSGIESQIGAGGGGGAKNYIGTVNGINGNGDFELGSTAGFSLFSTTLTGVIPTGTVAAPTAGTSLGVTLSPSNLIAGKYSGVFSGGTSFSAGQGLITDAFTIDNEDQAKVLSFKFAYKASAGATFNFSGTSTNTFAVYVYDVTAGAWIQPAGAYNLVQGTGIGIAQGSFQTSAASTQYRLALICINPYASGATLYVDDFQVGPNIATTGLIPKASNIVPITSVGSGTYTVPSGVYQIKVRMVGGGGGGTGVGGNSTGASNGGTSLFGSLLSATGGSFDGNFGGAGGSGTITAPAVGTVFTGGSGRGYGLNQANGATEMPGGTGGTNPFGGGGKGATAGNAGGDASPNTGAGGGGGGSTNTVNSASGTGGGAGGYVEAILPLSYLAANPTISYTVGAAGTGGLGAGGINGGAGGSGYIEITEFFLGANVQLSSDSDTRVVAMSAANITSSNTTTGVAQTITTFVVQKDTHSAYNAATGIYTVPVTGFYKISSNVLFASTATAGRFFLVANQAGSSVNQLYSSQSEFSSTVSLGTTLSGGLYCIAGDTLTIQSFQSSGGSLAYAAGNLYIARESGPAVVAQSEKTVFTAFDIAGSALAAGNIIQFASVQRDSHNAFSGGRYKCPTSGDYFVANNLYSVSAGQPTYAVYKNAVLVFTNYGSNTTAGGPTTASGIIPCLAGDFIDVRPLASQSLSSSAGVNMLSIYLIK